VSVFKRARSSITGRFITIAQALADKAHSVIETIKGKP
jgi:hypothetical protein